MFSKELSLDLNSILAVKEFTKVAGKSDCRVDVHDGQYLVNGKSIMGLLSLDLSKPVTIRVQGDTILKVECTTEQLKRCTPIIEVATNEL